MANGDDGNGKTPLLARPQAFWALALAIAGGWATAIFGLVSMNESSVHRRELFASEMAAVKSSIDAQAASITSIAADLVRGREERVRNDVKQQAEIAQLEGQVRVLLEEHKALELRVDRHLEFDGDTRSNAGAHK